jgi:SAM-dependent methyltransferase
MLWYVLALWYIVKGSSYHSMELRKTCYAAGKNKEFILEKLRELNPRRVFEVGSGTGEHAETFLAQLPSIEVYQPTEMDDSMFDSISAYTGEFGARCRPPLKLDVNNPGDVSTLESAAFDCLVCINIIHISPTLTTTSLFEVASRVLVGSGVVLTYGPYRVNGEMVESNVAFDLSLKNRNAEWGVRDLEWVAAEASKSSFELTRTISMPANNLVCVWKKTL